MIAHRLQTIATAQNLIYIDNPKRILAAEKGTAEYDFIMNKLKTETYKHQNDIGQETAKRLAEEESDGDEIPEEREFGPGEEGETGRALNKDIRSSFKIEKEASLIKFHNQDVEIEDQVE
jgi:hypothetical protein